MTETKFTPGPWTPYMEASPNDIHPDWGYRIITGGEDKASNFSVGGIVNKNDINLIAAAPELYEALVRMKEWCEDEVGAELPCDSINAALAKARGETL